MKERESQREIREQMMIKYPRVAPKTLDGYSVETISRADAIPIIMHYEWLRTVRGKFFVGLFSPTREIEGVACFGQWTGGNIEGIIGSPAFCLQRGACVHYAPPNAASFLINAACKLVNDITGVSRFFAYADPMAKEYGGVYQAAGWLYLGQGLNNGKGRERRRFVLPPGADRNDDAAWKTTRVLRMNGRHLSFKQAEKKGWELGWRQGKHVYVTNVGRDRKSWRLRICTLSRLKQERKKFAGLIEKIEADEIEPRKTLIKEKKEKRIEPRKILVEAGLIAPNEPTDKVMKRLSPYPAPKPKLKRKTSLVKHHPQFRIASPKRRQFELFEENRSNCC